MGRGLWFLSIFMLIVGSGLLILGTVLKRLSERRDHGLGKAKGIVVSLVLKDSGSDTFYKNSYYPVIEYFVKGKLYRSVYPVGAYPSEYKEGDHIYIAYDLKDPEKIRAASPRLKDQVPFILYLAGTGLLALSALVFIRFALRG